MRLSVTTSLSGLGAPQIEDLAPNTYDVAFTRMLAFLGFGVMTLRYEAVVPLLDYALS